ncbi:hypothetical protein HHK36_000655 [Tetracentron sinense]|uniref:Uncharacterized protein n=1 Tax=Tetracentron sinense TaxID=13715 RepID=A0A835A229_TETSI|nr:hypothetical protein HHK36_000655 [Tetracentron sinense]
MKIEEQATSLSLFGIFLSDRPIRMAAVLVSSFQLPQFNRKILFPPVAKEFGSVGVIGNPMGFTRNVGIDIKDFLSVTAKGILRVHNIHNIKACQQDHETIMPEF